MAIASTAVWEVRTTGSDTNGGGFDPGVASPGTDYSQQAAVQISYTDLVIGATNTQLTSSANPFSSLHPGNMLNVTGGSGFTTGWYEVLSVSGSTATMDRAVGTASSTGGTGNLGGAFATPGQAMAVAVASNTVYVQNTGGNAVYALSSTANVAGGRITISVGGGANNVPFQFIGYQSTRTLQNSDTPPTFNAGASMAGVAVQMVFLNSNYIRIRNFKMRNPNSYSGSNSSMLNVNGVYNLIELMDIDANSVASWYGVFINNNEENHFYDVAVQHVNGHYGFDGSSGSTNSFTGCYSANNTGGGYQGGGRFVRCVAYHNTGGGSDGFNTSSTPGSSYINCTAHSNGRHGFLSYYDTATDNCIAWNNTGYGWTSVANCPIATIYNCAGGGNGSGNLNQTAGNIPTWAVYNFVTLTADPCTNASGGDFSLNNTASAGAACRNAGYPASIYTTNTTGSGIDIGVWQHFVVILVAVFLPMCVMAKSEDIRQVMPAGSSSAARGGVFAAPPTLSPGAPTAVVARLGQPGICAYTCSFGSPAPPSPRALGQGFGQGSDHEMMQVSMNQGSAYSRGGWFIPDIISLIAGIINSASTGNFVFLPQDLVCPIDQYYSLVLYAQVLGGSLGPIHWQCASDPTHNGVLLQDTSPVPVSVPGQVATGPSVIPPSMNPSTIIGAAFTPSVPNQLPASLIVTPNILGNVPQTGPFTISSAAPSIPGQLPLPPLDPNSLAQKRQDPNAPPTINLFGGW